MKKLFLILPTILLAVSLFAQVTVTSETYYQPTSIVRHCHSVVNDLTDQVPVANVISNPVVFNQTLTSQFENNDIDTIVYAEPATEGDFTEETCSFTERSGMILHVAVDEEKASCLGVGGMFEEFGFSEPMAVKFEEPMIIAEFPCQLNSTYDKQSAGVYAEPISVLSNMLNEFLGSSYGPMMYMYLANTYDTLKVTVDVHFLSNFVEEGSMTIAGDNNMTGVFPYLRENRQYIYVSDVFFRKTDGTYVQIDNATMSTPLGTMNIGEMLSEQLNIDFPFTQTVANINYWTNNVVCPIVELNTNDDYTTVSQVAIRYGEGDIEDQVENNATVRVCAFPNPTNDYLNIAGNVANSTIQIYSTTGALMHESVLNSDFSNINVSKFENGVYFFRILGEKEINGKFVKE